MKASLLIVLTFAFAAGAVAQDRANSAPANTAVPAVQPPPALDEPGSPRKSDTVLPTPQVPPQAAPGADKPPAPAKPAESPGLPSEVQAAADAAELPVVTVRQQGTDTVEEYRKHGKLYFVRVLSSNGPARYYVDNPASVPPDMRKLSGPSGVVEPVYYKLFEWK